MPAITRRSAVVMASRVWAVWVHARRKFCKGKADVVIGKIRKLYRIEETIAPMDPEEKKVRRQIAVKPLSNCRENIKRKDAA